MEDAQGFCAAEGGMLPEPKTREENDFLNSLTTEKFYLGTTDMSTEGDWRWISDGSSVVWDFWRPGEPDGGSNQNCAIINMLRSRAVSNIDGWQSGWCIGATVTTVCEKRGKFINYHPLKNKYIQSQLRAAADRLF